jgi:hypothetical protein
MRDATHLGPYLFVIGVNDPIGSGQSCDIDTGGGPWHCSSFFLHRITCPVPRAIG